MNYGFLCLCCFLLFSTGINVVKKTDVGPAIFEDIVIIICVLWAMHWRF